MDWIEVTVKTTTQGIEPVSGILIMNGITGYTVEDSKDFNDFLEGKEMYWDYIEDSLMALKDCDTRITFYVSDDEQGKAIIETIKKDLEGLGNDDSEKAFGELSVTLGSVAEEDWADNWKKYFKPLPVGNRLVIKPTWESIADTELENRTVVEIDPSSSFGTGSHTTTKLCLEYIEKMFEKLGSCDEMLDVGCGSGILGIAAHKLGAKNITAIDIDENSVRVAKENFEVNNVPEKAYRLYAGSITDDRELFESISSKKYGMLAANIVADVLKIMAPYFKKLLREDGYAVISGILNERADEVAETFEKNGFSVIETRSCDDWTAIFLEHSER